MAGTPQDGQIELVARLTDAFAAEIVRHDARAKIPWPEWPDVEALVLHLAGVHRWVAEILRSGSAVSEDGPTRASVGDLRRIYGQGRAALLDSLLAVAPDTPCRVLGGGIGTAAFWHRRMVYETVKHLTDIRAAGGGQWRIAEELSPDDYADGIDELFGEFLPRSRPDLGALPGSVLMRATDSDRAWAISRDWAVSEEPQAGATASRIEARAGDLALVVWERADPLADPARFRLSGDPVSIAAFVGAGIHPATPRP